MIKRLIKPPLASGFALVPALFLIVVLGALGAVAIRLGSGQQHTVTMGMMQSRAMAAARAGVEWGAYRALQPPHACSPSSTLTLSEAALAGFTVQVACTATTFNDGSGSHSYVVSSTAISGTYGQPSYVRRVVSSTFTDATG